MFSKKIAERFFIFIFFVCTKLLSSTTTEFTAYDERYVVHSESGYTGPYSDGHTYVGVESLLLHHHILKRIVPQFHLIHPL